MTRLIAVIVFFVSYMSMAVQAMDHGKPLMLEDKFYKEYWEQHLLFDDGTFLTSQFLVANFPWPVGKDHGVMVSTLVRPDGERTIIKNGRNLGEWGFDPEKMDIFIHTHRLKNEGSQHVVQLRADDKSEVTITGGTLSAPLNHSRYERKDNFMESSFYLPFFQGEGEWRITEQKDKPAQQGKGKVQGFATHVILNGPLNDLMESWFRVSGLQNGKDQLIPFLSTIQRKNKRKESIFYLKDTQGGVISFPDIKIEYKDITEGEDNSSFPKTIEITARNSALDVEKQSVKGTIRLKRKIDHFNIYDHLNFFEKGFANSRASVTNFRYIAEYDFQYVSDKEMHHLTGQALSEFADILPPRKSKTRKTRRR